MESIYESLVAGDVASARAQLVPFLRNQFGLEVETLEFQQSAVSLNSFKGTFLTEDGLRYFFKTHIEAAGEVAEYAGAKLLEEFGYPIIVPVYVSAERGKELLIYPLIQDPSLFDLVVALRRGDSAVSVDELQNGQVALDQRLWQCYERSFDSSPPDSFPAVQQLFYRRLAGERFRNFYEGKSRTLGDEVVSFHELAVSTWTVNGRPLGLLGDWIEKARLLLRPEAMLPFTVVGHGDAHNGNVFFNPEGFRYFDPAYAGRHDPFLDLTKPLFHNTFARWMYFPEEVQSSLEISVVRGKGAVDIHHNFKPNAVEQAFFDSKMEHVLKPLVEFLSQRAVLPSDWQERLRASLLCCPLLTVNLFDEKKYSPEVSALGFAMVAEMANFDFNPYVL